MSGRRRTETIEALLMILRFSSSTSCMPASEQLHCSTREPLKASHGKHDNY